MESCIYHPLEGRQRKQESTYVKMYFEIFMDMFSMCSKLYSRKTTSCTSTPRCNIFSHIAIGTNGVENPAHQCCNDGTLAQKKQVAARLLWVQDDKAPLMPEMAVSLDPTRSETFGQAKHHRFLEVTIGDPKNRVPLAAIHPLHQLLGPTEGQQLQVLSNANWTGSWSKALSKALVDCCHGSRESKASPKVLPRLKTMKTQTLPLQGDGLVYRHTFVYFDVSQHVSFFIEVVTSQLLKQREGLRLGGCCRCHTQWSNLAYRRRPPGWLLECCRGAKTELLWMPPP